MEYIRTVILDYFDLVNELVDKGIIKSVEDFNILTLEVANDSYITIRDRSEQLKNDCWKDDETYTFENKVFHYIIDNYPEVKALSEKEEYFKIMVFVSW